MIDGTVGGLALRLHSEFGDTGNYRVGVGFLDLRSAEETMLELEFESGLTEFTDGVSELYRAD